MDQGLLFASLGPYLLSTAVFWVFGSVFLIVDLTGKPECFKKYKIQPGKNEPIQYGPLLTTIRVVMCNQLFIGLPVSFISGMLQQLRGCDLTLTFPDPIELIRDIIVCVTLEEFGFYYSHRLLHHPLLYRWIHKRHHEWTAPFSYVAMYAHPLEYVFSNITPLLVGPIVCGSRVLTTWLWFSVATLVTTVHHSGYHLPLLPSPELHDFHHLKYNVNYGLSGLLDWFHGTDAKFQAAPQSARHRLIYSAEDMKLKSGKAN